MNNLLPHKIKNHNFSKESYKSRQFLNQFHQFFNGLQPIIYVNELKDNEIIFINDSIDMEKYYAGKRCSEVYNTLYKTPGTYSPQLNNTLDQHIWQLSKQYLSVTKIKKLADFNLSTISFCGDNMFRYVNKTTLKKNQVLIKKNFLKMKYGYYEFQY